MGAKLERCGACSGFVANGASRCPHCRQAITSGGIARRQLGALGGALAFTLMACYGGPPPPHVCPDGSPDCTKPAAPPSPATPGPNVLVKPAAGDAGK